VYAGRGREGVNIYLHAPVRDEVFWWREEGCTGGKDQTRHSVS
jgi:hypothetical protein